MKTFRPYSLLFPVGLLVLTVSLPAQPAAPTPNELRALAMKAAFQEVLDVDKARFVAWQKGDFQAHDAMVSEFMGRSVFSWMNSGDIRTDKEGFLAFTHANQPSASLGLYDTSVKIFGNVSDGAYVTGIIREATPTPDNPGVIYTAVYLKESANPNLKEHQTGGPWELIRYYVTPLKLPTATANRAPSAPWSTDKFTGTQIRALNMVRSLFDAGGRRQWSAMDKVVGDDFYYINARVVGPVGVLKGKKEYLEFRTNNPSPPQVVAMNEPDIEIVCEYGEIQLVDGIIGFADDATGGATYGTNLNSEWKNASYYLAIVNRPKTNSDEFRVVHYHAAFIQPTLTLTNKR